MTRSFAPHLALVLLGGVHVGPHRAVEVPGEVVHVGEGSLDTELVRTVDTGENPQLEGLGPVLGTPDISSRHLGTEG